MNISEITRAIQEDPQNETYTREGVAPLFTATSHARIVIVGQAPGRKATASGIPWDDASGDKLREWLGVTKEQFYNPELIALIPMDFYYPGKGSHGDLPPRKGFAEKWHPRPLADMPEVALLILVGKYAQAHYLGSNSKRNLTETVGSYNEYLPKFFPIVHPSPLNFRWQTKNPWFLEAVIPKLQKIVATILNEKS